MKIRYFYGLLLILGCAFFLMNMASPLRCDDLAYQYFWLSSVENGYGFSVDLNHRINSFYDAFLSQINHYQNMNGRFLVHFLVQCFCGFIGKPIFNICNSFMYVLFIVGCCKLINTKEDSENILTSGLLWLGLPIQYIFSFDIAFAINYLWTATIIVYFLILILKYSKDSHDTTFIQSLLLILFGFVCGATHEGFSLPISGALFFYSLYHIKHLNKEFLCLTIGLWIGTLTIVLAPGTIVRGRSVMEDMDWQALILQKLDIIRYSKRLYILLLFLAIVTLQKGKQIGMNFIKENTIIIGTIVLDFLFVFSLSKYSQRMEFPLEWLSLLLTIKIIKDTKWWHQYKHYACIALVILCAIHIPITCYFANKVGNEYADMIKEYKESPEGKTHFQSLYIPKIFIPYVHRIDETEQSIISFTMGKEIVIVK